MHLAVRGLKSKNQRAKISVSCMSKTRAHASAHLVPVCGLGQVPKRSLGSQLNGEVTQRTVPHFHSTAKLARLLADKVRRHGIGEGR